MAPLLLIGVIFVGTSFAEPTHNNSVLLSLALELDTAFFDQLQNHVTILHIWHVNGTRLVLNPDSPLETLCFMEAPYLNDLQLYPNRQLIHLIIRNCPLASLIAPLRNLHALRILKLELCRLNGTFNMAELLALPNVSSFSLEGNHITDVTLLMDAVPTAGTGNQPSPLTVLNLALNQIEHFTLDVLRPFTKLEDLLLSYNRIVTLGGIVWLPALMNIDMKQNHLTQVDLSGCNCSALHQVYLADNRLSQFPVFSGTSDGIITLDLHTNHLTVLNLEVLNRLKNLTHLLLGKNALQELTGGDGRNGSVVVELPALARLELSSNQIETLHVHGWHMPLLSSLRLEQNPLRELPDDLMQRFPLLTNMACMCPDVACKWVEREVEHIRSWLFEMSVAWLGPHNVGDGYQCVHVPKIGCVRCLASKTSSENKD